MNESGNIAPKTKWDYFKSAPRPLLKYVCVPLIPVVILSSDISETKVSLFFWFCAGLFTVRGAEKIADMVTGRKNNG